MDVEPRPPDCVCGHPSVAHVSDRGRCLVIEMAVSCECPEYEAVVPARCDVRWCENLATHFDGVHRLCGEHSPVIDTEPL